MPNNYETCPYNGRAPHTNWKKSFTHSDASDLCIPVRDAFTISKNDRIATAGSCFAQHVARHLKSSGYTYFDAEAAPYWVPDEVKNSFNYGVFSARYGNIYTSRQWLQLLRRAYGAFEPQATHWHDGEIFIDPMRPFIQPSGFISYNELEADRRKHLAAVRQTVEQANIFVFTMGLTEAWLDTRDGTVFPICPGCGAGTFDPKIHHFVNFDYNEIQTDMAAAIEFLKQKNPSLKIILTVSPVPLAATATDEHVLTATTYSKSVLRAVAGKLSETIADVVYFPSYEIITGTYSQGAYFEADLRSIKESGVSHVMRVFFKAFSQDDQHMISPQQVDSHSGMEVETEHLARMAIICDEEKQLLGVG